MEDLQILHIEHWHNFLLAFIPLFIAIDVVGILPIFISLVEGLEKHQKTKITNQSVITAFSVSIGFLALGKFVFSVLGIEIYDFKMAGGLLLLVFAINDLLFSEKGKRTITPTMGVVPEHRSLEYDHDHNVDKWLFYVNSLNLFIVWIVFMKSNFHIANRWWLRPLRLPLCYWQP